MNQKRGNEPRAQLLAPIRVSEEEHRAINQLREASDTSLANLVIENVLCVYDRGYKIFLPKTQWLIGKDARLVEDNASAPESLGEITDIYEPKPRDNFRANRPYLYVHFHHYKENVDSIKIWGFGNPLIISDTKFYVEDFLISSRTTCYKCDAKLEKKILGLTSKRQSLLYPLCQHCFPKEQKEKLSIELC